MALSMGAISEGKIAFLSPEPGTVPKDGVGTYVPGGRNVMADRYVHSEGYPPFPNRTRFIGTLTGDWYEMGLQFGSRSGDAVRCVSDIWWKTQCEMWGRDETLKAIGLYEAQIQALDPNLVAFMKGIEEGAAPWLSQSPYMAEGTHYQRVLVANIHDEWTMHHPLQFPDGTSSFGGTEIASLETGVVMCSGFSARGRATLRGETLAAQNRHCGYDPRCYAQVYVIRPEGGNACWVLSNCPQVS